MDHIYNELKAARAETRQRVSRLAQLDQENAALRDMTLAQDAKLARLDAELRQLEQQYKEMQ